MVDMRDVGEEEIKEKDEVETLIGKWECRGKTRRWIDWTREEYTV